MASLSMPNWLEKRAALTPNRIALKSNHGEWTFAELQKRSKQTAMRLGSLGIERGDHVALLIQNNLEAVELIHALEYIGAVIVLLNVRLTPFELSWQIQNSNAKLLVFDPVFTEKAN